jgi:hypothetical protein
MNLLHQETMKATVALVRKARADALNQPKKIHFDHALGVSCLRLGFCPVKCLTTTTSRLRRATMTVPGPLPQASPGMAPHTPRAMSGCGLHQTSKKL